MSKFRIKMKLQGFELEIEGSRDEASQIGRTISDQLTGMLSPNTTVIDGAVTSTRSAEPPAAQLVNDSNRKRSRRPTRSNSPGERESAQVVDFRHDPSKFGVPTQQWKTAQKAIWLIYVVKEAANVPELSAALIAKTFNTHFRQAGTITPSNVSRDLGRSKISAPPLVGEDTTKSPAAWYLTDEGVRKVQTMISEALANRSE